jgi:hypothetical protein
LWVESVAWSTQRIPTAVNVSFLDRSPYFLIQVASQLSSRGWMNPVPDPLLLRQPGRAGNRSRDLWICSQKVWPLDHTAVCLLQPQYPKSVQWLGWTPVKPGIGVWFLAEDNILCLPHDFQTESRPIQPSTEWVLGGWSHGDKAAGMWIWLLSSI